MADKGRSPSSANPSAAPDAASAAKPIKPRAGVQRRSQAARDQYAKQEAEREQARVKSQGTGGGAAARGGKSSGRGRGGAQPTRDDRGGSRNAVSGASGVSGGVFGAGSGLKPGGREKGMLGVARGESELLSGERSAAEQFSQTQEATLGDRKESGPSGSSGPSTSRPGRSKHFGAEVVAESTSEDEQPSKDIEYIDISSNEEDIDEAGDDDDPIRGSKRAVKHRTPKHGSGLRPVRAPRMIKDEQESEEIKEKKTHKSTKMLSEVENIDIDEDVMDVDEETTNIKENPSSPEIKKTKPSRRDSRRSKEVKTGIATVEEQAERRRLQEDIHRLRNEFLHDFPPSKRESQTTRGTIDTHNYSDEEKLLLFQFPPMIPFLIDPQAPLPVQVKKEEPSTTEVITSDKTQQKTTTIATDDAEQGNIDDQTPNIPPLQHEGLLTATEPRPLPTGYVGKLRIHKSGKVSLDWAGTDMEIRYGSEVDFLQDAVLVQTPVEGPKGQDGQTGSDTAGEGSKNVRRNDDEESTDVKKTGRTIALGQVRKKMVVVPDWGKLYD